MGRDFQSQTQPPCQAHKEPAHTPATSCAGARPRRRRHVLPRTQAEAPSHPSPLPPEPQTSRHTSTRARPAVPRLSRACTRTLLSLPFLGHSVIRFLNLEATQGPARDGSPPPPAACGQPAGVLRSGHDPAGASWSWGLLRAAGQSQAQPHPAAVLSGHMGPHWGHPAGSHVARHTSGQSYGAFFLLLNHGLGTKPQGGEVWIEENEWAKGRSELRGLLQMKRASAALLLLSGHPAPSTSSL